MADSGLLVLFGRGGGGGGAWGRPAGKSPKIGSYVIYNVKIRFWPTLKKLHMESAYVAILQLGIRPMPLCVSLRVGTSLHQLQANQGIRLSTMN